MVPGQRPASVGPQSGSCLYVVWVPIIRSWALTRGYALHPGTSCVASFTGSSRCWHGLRCVAGARRTSSTNTEEPPDQPRQGFGHPQRPGRNKRCFASRVSRTVRSAAPSVAPGGHAANLPPAAPWVAHPNTPPRRAARQHHRTPREHPALDPSSDQPLQAMPQKCALTSLFGASCENVESPH